MNRPALFAITGVLTLVFGFFWTPVAMSAQAGAPAPQSVRPVLVELFTSQGCSSCPQANEFLADLSRQPDVIALSFAVDYWDYLGWHDTFASPAFTARQYAYGKALKNPRVYTPQMIIDGQQALVGVRQSKVRSAVNKRAHRDNATVPKMQARLNEQGKIVLDITGPPAKGLTIWMAAYTPGTQHVLVKRGENAGRKLVQVNMVSALTRLGTWSGGQTRMVMPMPEDGGCAIFLQDEHQGPILAAVKVEA